MQERQSIIKAINQSSYTSYEDVVVPPMFFFYGPNKVITPFPMTYYQFIKEPFHIRAFCKCKCCKTILCKHYVYSGLMKSPDGYINPKMWMGVEIFTAPIIIDHRNPDAGLQPRVFEIYEILDLKDGRFFSLVKDKTY